MSQLPIDNGTRLRLAEPLLLLLLALAVRLSLFPYWQDLKLSGDEVYYWDLARLIADGNLPKAFLRPPLWSYVLSLSAFICEHYACGRLFTAIISSFSVPLIYWLGKCVFNRKVGIISAITFCIYPNVLGFSHYLWSESFFTLLILLSTFLFFKSLGNEKSQLLLYSSFFVSGVSLLAKESAVIHFASTILTVATTELANKKAIITKGIIIFLTPVTFYSVLATVSARRPVILADAFVYNSNEADLGKVVFSKSTGTNLKIFMDRLLVVKEMPARFARQLSNLWAPNSFLIFRLLRSEQKYDNLRFRSLIAFVTAGLYILVIALGLTGICCAENRSFQVFAVANLLFLSVAGSLFLLCSRFRIPFMYIFVMYTSLVLCNPRAVLTAMTWRKALPLLAILALFVEIIIAKRSSFGYWG